MEKRKRAFEETVPLRLLQEVEKVRESKIFEARGAAGHNMHIYTTPKSLLTSQIFHVEALCSQHPLRLVLSTQKN